MNKQDDKQERVIPKLRFPEFQTTLGWDKDILGNLFAERSKKNNLEKTVLAATQDKGVIPYELMEKSVIRDRKNLGGYKLVLPEDFVISLRSFEGGFEYSKYEGIISPAYVVLYPKIKIYNYFFRIYFKQDSFIQQIQNSLNNSLRDGKSISYKQASTLSIALPQIEEQQKIADCLSSIDELINFREQKLAALKQHKKGLMQQLFPSHNDLQASKQAIVYPKLRFPQFKDCKGWEVVRISDLLVEKKRSVKLENETEYCLVTVKRRHGGITLREIAKGKEIKVQSQFRVFKNDFLISKRQIVHCACGVLPEELDGSIVSNEYSVLNAKENVNIAFFNYFCRQPIVEKSFLDCSSGIVIEKMLFKLEKWMKQEFYFPKNPKEQQAIADCLSSLDRLIDEEKEQIGRLKDHKKGLMQQLFPKFRNYHE